MLRRSRARCQPGLNRRPPSTLRCWARSLSSSSLASASSISARLADDADEVVHRLLQLLVQRVRVLAALGRRTARARSHRRVDDAWSTAGRAAEVRRRTRPRRARRRACRRPAGRTASCRRAGWSRACRRTPRPRRTARARGRPRGVGVDLDAAHHVVAGRADLHRLRGDVDVGQLLELVVHRRQPLEDLGGRRREAMSRKTPPCGVPRPALTSELIARATSSRGSSSGGRWLLSGSVYQRSPLLLGLGVLPAEDVGDVVEHEPLALGVLQHAAVAADRLGDEDALDRRRPDHARSGGTGRTPC